MAEFGAELSTTYVMGGLAGEFKDPPKELAEQLEATAATGMPADPRLWLERPPTSSFPACQAVKAAGEQRLDADYLRSLREGFALERRPLDTAEALIDRARNVAGIDVERFAIDLRSHAIVELFAADHERARTAAPQTHGDSGRIPFPSFECRGAGGEVHGVYGEHAVGPLREAVIAAGGTAGPLPDVEQALRRFRRMATPEVAGVCDLPGPRAAAELWRLTADWRVRNERVLAGDMWSPA